MKTIDTIEDWINYKPLNFVEKVIMTLPRSNFNFPWHNHSPKKFRNMERQFFSLVDTDSLSIKTNSMSFDRSATRLINKLFKHYVGPDTLVISSRNEHPSVRKNLDKSKNTYLLHNSTSLDSMYDDILSIEEILQTRKFSNIFIYIIGTRVDTGLSTPLEIYELIKKMALQYNKNVIVVIDAVQEIFMWNRDYSMFDYIIGTGHAYVKKYDLGIMITKKGLLEFGNKNYKWGNGYLKRLHILFKRKDKLFMFNDVLSRFFGIEDKASVPYLYHIYTKYSFTKKEEKKSRNYCRLHLDGSILRARAIYYILWHHMLIRLKKYIPYLLDKKAKE